MENTNVRTNVVVAYLYVNALLASFCPRITVNMICLSFVILFMVLWHILPTFYAVFTFNEKRVHKLKSDISVRCRFMLPLSCVCVCAFFSTSSPSSCSFGRYDFCLAKFCWPNLRMFFEFIHELELSMFISVLSPIYAISKWNLMKLISKEID